MYKKNSKVLRKHFRILKEYAHIYTQSIVLERIEALQRVTLQNKKKPLRS